MNEEVKRILAFTSIMTPENLSERKISQWTIRKRARQHNSSLEYNRRGLELRNSYVFWCTSKPLTVYTTHISWWSIEYDSLDWDLVILFPHLCGQLWTTLFCVNSPATFWNTYPFMVCLLAVILAGGIWSVPQSHWNALFSKRCCVVLTARASSVFTCLPTFVSLSPPLRFVALACYVPCAHFRQRQSLSYVLQIISLRLDFLRFSPPCYHLLQWSHFELLDLCHGCFPARRP